MMKGPKIWPGADPPDAPAIKPVAPEHLVGDLIQPGHPLFGIVWINRQRVSGEPCFYASRVPIASLYHYTSAGHTLAEFLDDFPGVTAEQAKAVLYLAFAGLLESLPKP